MLRVHVADALFKSHPTWKKWKIRAACAPSSSSSVQAVQKVEVDHLLQVWMFWLMMTLHVISYQPTEPSWTLVILYWMKRTRAASFAAAHHLSTDGVYFSVETPSTTSQSCMCSSFPTSLTDSIMYYTFSWLPVKGPP